MALLTDSIDEDQSQIYDRTEVDANADADAAEADAEFDSLLRKSLKKWSKTIHRSNCWRRR